MSHSPEVSTSPLTLDFVVPCGRPESPAAGDTLACLAEITKGVSSKVIVVAAGVSALKSRYPETFTRVDTKERLWPADNRNLGAKHSEAGIIAFLDDDCRLEPDVYEKVLGRFATLDWRRCSA